MAAQRAGERPPRRGRAGSAGSAGGGRRSRPASGGARAPTAGSGRCAAHQRARIGAMACRPRCGTGRGATPCRPPAPPRTSAHGGTAAPSPPGCARAPARSPRSPPRGAARRRAARWRRSSISSAVSASRSVTVVPGAPCSMRPSPARSSASAPRLAAAEIGGEAQARSACCRAAGRSARCAGVFLRRRRPPSAMGFLDGLSLFAGLRQCFQCPVHPYVRHEGWRTSGTGH